jgi:serine/threonine protein kinase
MQRRHKVGEGGFGCVHKHSLKCSGKKNINYNKYISKLMKKKSATKELKDFVIVSKVDSANKYHLGTPIICTPDVDNEDTIRDINECKRFNAQTVRENPEAYRILLLKDGGNDLSIFCKHHLHHFINENSHNVYRFWLEARHLVEGIHFFNSRGIVHYDLKPQNIVFDPQTYKLMFIDFGLMDTKPDIISKAKKGSLHSANFHWSYPFDNGFLNKDYFMYYKNLTPEQKKIFKDKFAQYLFTDTSSTASSSIDLYIKKPHAFNLLFSYIYIDNSDENKYRDVDMFFRTFNQFISEHSYEETIKKTVNSLDIYGLGFTLKYMLNHFYMAKAITREFYDMFSHLFERMYSFDFNKRMDDTSQVLKEYDELLEKNGINSILQEESNTSTSLNNNATVLLGNNSNPIFGVKQFQSNYIYNELDKYAYEDAHTNSYTSSKKTRRRKNKGGKKKSIKKYKMK